MKQRLSLLAALLLLASGCGDDGAGSSGSNSESVGEDSSSGGTATVTATGTITDFVAMAPIEGAMVCVVDLCGTTDAEGFYTIAGIPVGAPGPATVTHADYVPQALHGIVPAVDFEQGTPMLSGDALLLFGNAIGITFDDSLAHISTGAFAAGASFVLTPMSGIGPAYVTDAGLPSLDIDATESGGVAGYANVNVGTVEMSASLADGTPCTISEDAVAGSTPNSAAMHLLPGHFNSPVGGYICPDP